jgi:hypothetical protein
VLESLRDRGFQVEFQSHAKAILLGDFPKAIDELEAALSSLSIPIEDIVGSGGGETKHTQTLRRALNAVGWKKHIFEIKKLIDGKEREAISHEIDHVRELNSEKIALEIEWNNKDPFFDRDLENFKRLHAEGAISVGVIVTRGESLQNGMRDLVMKFATHHKISSFDDLVVHGINPTLRQKAEVERRVGLGSDFAQTWTNHFCSDKFGAATTHWRKLQDRVRRGVGNPCPLLLIGLPAGVVKFKD